MIRLVIESPYATISFSSRSCRPVFHSSAAAQWIHYKRGNCYECVKQQDGQQNRTAYDITENYIPKVLYAIFKTLMPYNNKKMLKQNNRPRESASGAKGMKKLQLRNRMSMAGRAGCAYRVVPVDGEGRSVLTICNLARSAATTDGSRR